MHELKGLSFWPWPRISEAYDEVIGRQKFGGGLLIREDV